MTMKLGGLNSKRKGSLGGVVLSAFAHCAVLALLLYAGRSYVAPMLLPGDANGTRMTLTYLPGRAAAAESARSPEAKTSPLKTTEPTIAERSLFAPAAVIKPSAKVPDVKQSATSSPNINSPASANPNAATGADSLGTGNINIAYLDSFRSPRPDLSSLPRGVSGDVVLDVTIDTAGRIIELKKLSGVGYGIDESVVATVQAWVFHPATRDGTPVVSEQELHFHYEGRNG